MSSNDRSSARRAVTSLWSASMTASRSPSSVMGAPLVVLMMRMGLSPGSRKAFDRGRLVGVNLDEVLRAGHRQHRLDAFLNARELEMPAGRRRLAVEIHQAADRRAVDVRDRREIDQDVLPAGRQQRSDGRRELAEDGIHEARLADAYDGHAADLIGFDIHLKAPGRRAVSEGVDSSLGL